MVYFYEKLTIALFDLVGSVANILTTFDVLLSNIVEQYTRRFSFVRTEFLRSTFCVYTFIHEYSQTLWVFS